MPPTEPQDISRALLGYLYDLMTGQPEIEASGLPDDRFVAWCQPGIPFRKEDFDFSIVGPTGNIVEPTTDVIDETVGDVNDVTPVEGDDATMGERVTSEPDRPDAGALANQRSLAAYQWSRLANFVPDPDGVYDDEGQKKMFDTTAFSQDGTSILTIYRNVLNYSEVAASELTEEEKARIEKLRSLLVKETEITDIFGEPTDEIERGPSPFVTKYKEYALAYDEARMQLIAKRAAALAGDDEQASIEWTLGGDIYKRRVQAAYEDWVSLGRKHDYEKVQAYLDQVGRRNLLLLKRELLNDLEHASHETIVGNADYYWTSIIPATLLRSEGWQTYTLTENMVDTYRNKKSNSWGGSAAGSFGFFRFGGSGGKSKQEINREVDTSNFQMKFEMAQAMIDRWWFSPEFLFSNAWRWSDDLPEGLDYINEGLSNGETPPEGAMIAYPTAAMFVRNVSIKSREFESESNFVNETVRGGGVVGIGPFVLGGKAKKGEEEYDYESHSENGELSIPGTQLIGFKCKLLPKLPNPSDEVEHWDYEPAEEPPTADD